MPEPLRRGDLTHPEYWAEQHSGGDRGRRPEGSHERRGPPRFEWADRLAELVRPYEGGRFLELGCSPGDVSVALCSRVRLRPEGVDFSPDAHKYVDALRALALEPVLHPVDVREFHPAEPYDVVGSVGLVEHFADPTEILDAHDRLLRPGGLCFVIVPHFRGLQFVYHRLFDRPDLERHNVETMQPAVFQRFAERHRHEVLELRHFGRLWFWGVHRGGNRVVRTIRKEAAHAARRLAEALSDLLPSGHPLLAPWLVYVGRKPGS